MKVSSRSLLTWLRLPLLALSLAACGGPQEDLSTDPLQSTAQELYDLSGTWAVSNYSPVFRISISQSGTTATATKLDNVGNVPAGQTHWFADVVTGSGQGQIAESGFVNPRYVAGTLVITDNDHIQFTFSSGGTFNYTREP
ncbi:Cyclin D1-binding domain-containing protein [Pyxidicoccus sp. 3LFB2]